MHSHNLKIRLETEEFRYKPVSKSGSKLTVRNEKGEIIHEGSFKSFTANFMKLLYGNMIGSGTVTATDLNGDSSAIDEYPNVKMNFAGGSGIQKFGIGVGSDFTAVSSSDNDLTWVTGLTYGNVIVGTPAIDGSTVKLDITREISNTSGSTKSLYESGLIIGSESETDENILIARDLVDVTLANNEKSTWTYSIVVDFNSTTGGFVKNFLDSFIVDWTEVLADGHSQWSKRRFHQCVVHDSKIWIIGGYDSVNSFNDVWNNRKQLESSEDASEDTYGIIVGTSDTAFSGTATDLTSKISHGTGSGELEYGAFPDSVVTVEPSITGNKTQMKLGRRFENNSGGSITIKEIGIMSKNGLLCRFIPETPIVISNGASEVISIVFETEV
jgi:hypothetical protein